MTTATRLMTLDDFLALPETEPPSEFSCGRIIPKPMPNYDHALLMAEILGLLRDYLRETRLGVAIDNLRYAHRPEGRAYLPDVSVILREHRPRGEDRKGPIYSAPDIAIEVMSPDDRPGRIADKLAFYFRCGVPLIWHIDPEEQTLIAYRRPVDASTVHRAPEVIDAAPVLPGFRFDLGSYFAVLSDED